MEEMERTCVTEEEQYLLLGKERKKERHAVAKSDLKWRAITVLYCSRNAMKGLLHCSRYSCFCCRKYMLYF
jgi:hypothetical protein